eukprot:EG_transcript_32254
MDEPVYGYGLQPRRLGLLAKGATAAFVLFEVVTVGVGVMVGLQISPPLTACSVATAGCAAVTLLLGHWCHQDNLEMHFRQLFGLLVLISITLGSTLIPLALVARGPQDACYDVPADRVCIDRTDVTYCRAPAPPDCFWHYGACTVNGRCGVVTATSHRVTYLGNQEALNHTCTVPNAGGAGGDGYRPGWGP